MLSSAPALPHPRVFQDGLLLGKDSYEVGDYVNGALCEHCPAANATITMLQNLTATSKALGKRLLYECHGSGSINEVAAFLCGAVSRMRHRPSAATAKHSIQKLRCRGRTTTTAWAAGAARAGTGWCVRRTWVLHRPLGRCQHAEPPVLFAGGCDGDEARGAPG